MSLDRLKPEEKVNLAISMTDVCIRICIDAVKDRYGPISEEELAERVRERIIYSRRIDRGA